MMLNHLDPATFDTLSYDLYCPSVHKNGKLEKMLCRKCGVYFATQVAKRSHLCSLNDESDIEIDDNEPSRDAPDVDETFPVIKNLRHWMNSDFDCTSKD